jgi:hypothetical protein
MWWHQQVLSFGHRRRPEVRLRAAAVAVSNSTSCSGPEEGIGNPTQHLACITSVTSDKSPEGDLSAFPEEVRGARRGERLLGITVLGIPVGSDGFVVRVLEDAVSRLAPDRSQGAAPARVTSLERLSKKSCRISILTYVIGAVFYFWSQHWLGFSLSQATW